MEWMSNWMPLSTISRVSMLKKTLPFSKHFER
ncbi:hypothetical protein BH23CHL4_BH23CHL4_29080 [soil metagenome]